MYRFVQGRDEAIKGKHPQIGSASELPASLLPAELSLRRRPDDLAAPAKHSVDDESNDHVALSRPLQAQDMHPAQLITRRNCTPIRRDGASIKVPLPTESGDDLPALQVPHFKCLVG